MPNKSGLFVLLERSVYRVSCYWWCWCCWCDGQCHFMLPTLEHRTWAYSQDGNFHVVVLVSSMNYSIWGELPVPTTTTDRSFLLLSRLYSRAQLLHNSIWKKLLSCEFNFHILHFSSVLIDRESPEPKLFVVMFCKVKILKFSIWKWAS